MGMNIRPRKFKVHNKAPSSLSQQIPSLLFTFNKRYNLCILNPEKVNMFDYKDPEVNFAVNVVRQAALLVKTVQSQMVSDALTKGDKSPVTVADFASQAYVAKQLMDTFPGVPMVGEESSTSLKTEENKQTLQDITHFVNTIIPNSTETQVCDWIDFGSTTNAQKFWTLDPIDGTKGFLRGQQYAVAFALVEDAEVKIGVLGCPNLKDGYIEDIGGEGSLVVAVKGQGTWVTSLTDPEQPFKQINVSNYADPADTRFLRSFEAGHTNVSQLDYIAQEMGVSAEPVRLDSQAKYSILAAGAGDCIFRLISSKMPDYVEKIWDQAAGYLVAVEAGGTVTDLNGKPLDFSTGKFLSNNRGVLATNTHLHQACLAAIKAVEA